MTKSKFILIFLFGFFTSMMLSAFLNVLSSSDQTQYMTLGQQYLRGYKDAVKDLYYGEDPEMTDDLSPMKGMDI
jgi:hypothetical protein